MSKENKNVVLVCSIIAFILVLSFIVSLFVRRNKESINNTIYIFQYQVEDFNIVYDNEPVLLYKFTFTNDLYFDKIINSIDNKYFNHVIISNGTIKVTDSNCKNKLCMNHKIKLYDTVFDGRTIICAPSGLYICVK